MHMIVMTVSIVKEKVQIMHTIKGQDGKQELLLVHWLGLVEAGELSRRLADAVDKIMKNVSNVLPDKRYEPKAGRSNA